MEEVAEAEAGAEKRTFKEKLLDSLSAVRALPGPWVATHAGP